MVLSDCRKIWKAALGELELQMARATFDTWLRDTHCLGVEEGNVLIVGVQNGYAVEWLTHRLHKVIRRTLHRITGEEWQVRFVVWDIRPPDDPPDALALPEESPVTPVPAPILNTRYTFQDFVVGPSNHLAQAAALAVSEQPGDLYNPLFICGGVGLGKTHLLQAIGFAGLQAGKRVLYVTAETFTNDLVEAIRTQATARFREKYRTPDVLLVDDVHFLVGKENTQEELFHTFNALHDAQRQIVLSGDRHPNELKGLPRSLRSRFSWGLVADVRPPNYATRMEILRAMAQRAQVSVPEDVLEYIATKFEHNVRELEGALNQVLASARLLHRPLTRQTVRDVLPKGASRTEVIAPAQVLATVADYYGLTLDDLRGSVRSRRVALPRQVAMYLLREESKVSLPRIGAELGGRDHSTVRYGCRRIHTRLDRDDQLRREVALIKNQLRARSLPHK